MKQNRFGDFIDKLEKSKTDIKIDEPTEKPKQAPASAPKLMFDPTKGPLHSAEKKPLSTPSQMKILFDPSKKAGPKAMDAKNVKTVDVAKKQLESHVDEQVHKADKDNK